MRPLALLLPLSLCLACLSRGRPAPEPEAPAPLPVHTSCTGKTLGVGTHALTLEHQGRTRHYRLHVPPGYDPARPTPGVLSFHGFGSDEPEQEALTRLSEEADARGFLAVYPRGLTPTALGREPTPPGDLGGWNAGVCCGAARDAGVDDVGFVDALLADLDARVCLDTKRVYATGFSNGGFLSYRLACERSGQFAAIAPVAGVEGSTPCAPTRPVPVMHFHGSADGTIQEQGGTHPFLSGPHSSVSDTVARWAERNGCTGEPRTTFQKGDSRCDTWESCAQGATVTRCGVQGGGHTWPGGMPIPELGHTTTDLDATAEMWRFFAAHPRP